MADAKYKIKQNPRQLWWEIHKKQKYWFFTQWEYLGLGSYEECVRMMNDDIRGDTVNYFDEKGEKV